MCVLNLKKRHGKVTACISTFATNKAIRFYTKMRSVNYYIELPI